MVAARQELAEVDFRSRPLRFLKCFHEFVDFHSIGPVLLRFHVQTPIT
jgi:hypothetical protein